MNRPILITGCQRSGTTLLHLILDSHPDIRGIDEMQFDPRAFPTYLNHPAFAPCFSIKLPPAAAEIPFIRSIPNLKLLWCVRDPREVVASMITLKLDLEPGTAVPWACHPLGAGREIQRCLEVLPSDTLSDLDKETAAYKALLKTHPARWSRDDAVLSAALCWRLKNELPALYRRHALSFHIVKYDDLVSHPRRTIGKILDYIGAPWDDRVLEHHRLHDGVLVGQTPGSRPIDRTSMDKWRHHLTERDLHLIEKTCGTTARSHGYLHPSET